MGNKNDLILERKVEVEEAQKKCKELNIIWGGECSAKNNSQEDLVNIFETLIAKLF